MGSLSVLRNIGAKGAVKRFAAKYNLVYFGGVNARDDEHELVRGLTATAHHVDSNYTVGTINNYDLIFVERHNRASHPGLASAEHHWLILRINLKRTGLPHVFIDAHHDNIFHANLRIAHSTFQNISAFTTRLDKVSILAEPGRLGQVNRIISQDFVQNVGQFSRFDYEIDGDQLFVYAHNLPASEPALNDMLRIGMWIAEYLDVLELPET
jgi:hypothetical protein